MGLFSGCQSFMPPLLTRKNHSHGECTPCTWAETTRGKTRVGRITFLLPLDTSTTPLSVMYPAFNLRSNSAYELEAILLRSLCWRGDQAWVWKSAGKTKYVPRRDRRFLTLPRFLLILPEAKCIRSQEPPRPPMPASAAAGVTASRNCSSFISCGSRRTTTCYFSGLWFRSASTSQPYISSV